MSPPAGVHSSVERRGAAQRPSHRPAVGRGQAVQLRRQRAHPHGERPQGQGGARRLGGHERGGPRGGTVGDLFICLHSSGDIDACHSRDQLNY